MLKGGRGHSNAFDTEASDTIRIVDEDRSVWLSEDQGRKILVESGPATARLPLAVISDDAVAAVASLLRTIPKARTMKVEDQALLRRAVKPA